MSKFDPIRGIVELGLLFLYIYMIMMFVFEICVTCHHCLFWFSKYNCLKYFFCFIITAVYIYKLCILKGTMLA